MCHVTDVASVFAHYLVVRMVQWIVCEVEGVNGNERHYGLQVARFQRAQETP